MAFLSNSFSFISLKILLFILFLWKTFSSFSFWQIYFYFISSTKSLLPFTFIYLNTFLFFHSLKKFLFSFSDKLYRSFYHFFEKHSFFHSLTYVPFLFFFDKSLFFSFSYKHFSFHSLTKFIFSFPSSTKIPFSFIYFKTITFLSLSLTILFLSSTNIFVCLIRKTNFISRKSTLGRQKVIHVTHMNVWFCL